MIWIHVLFAVGVAVAFTAVLLAIDKGNAYERGGWAAVLVLFAILFLTSWAGGIWLNPIGPQLLGAAWLPFVFMGFVMAMLMAAMYPARRPRSRAESEESAAAEEVVGTTVTAFLWIFAVCLIAAITIHYAYLDQRQAGQMAGRETREVLR
jgi:hypothetical protein